MSYHGKQYATEKRVCKCGCGMEFYPVPKYRPKAEGGGKWFPEYIRGHNPACKKAIAGQAWNKGLTKADHPSIERMGYQPGHEPHNDWSHVNERMKVDPEFKQKCIESRIGKIIPKNKGTGRTRKCSTYHEQFRLFCLERDGFACKLCGVTDVRLEVHHIIPEKVDPSLLFDTSNGITLCVRCHRRHHLCKKPTGALV